MCQTPSNGSQGCSALALGTNTPNQYPQQQCNIYIKNKQRQQQVTQQCNIQYYFLVVSTRTARVDRGKLLVQVLPIYYFTARSESLDRQQ